MNPLHPFGGPQPRDDSYPDIDRAELEACRLILGMPVVCGELEEYASAAELNAARELEEWGCNPFEEN